MRIQIACFLWLLVFAGVDRAATVPEGIPRELARERAAVISDVRYHLQFTLTPHADSAIGHEELQFRAKAAAATLLDFREGAISRIVVNGKELTFTELARTDSRGAGHDGAQVSEGKDPRVSPTREAPAEDTKAELRVRVVNGHIELPASAMRAGENTVSIDFAAPVAAAGKAITRFEDKDDGSEYIYTLFVPMDAEMAFPCFDQPDLKGKFHLEVVAPVGWTVISNTPVLRNFGEVGGLALKHTDFAETKPISTYLFAFAAGPFKKLPSSASSGFGIYVRQSKFEKARAEAGDVEKFAIWGVKYLSEYFAQPFPFPKYDQVLIPGFAYGGMEHAGATFLREESVLFRSAPTRSDYLNRDILVLHELTHQWFGDFTTMRWFDDLWLKEGFAQYMAYQALANLLPQEEEQIWERFYLGINSAAYAIDSTKGTTPIHQDIGNLKDAKSAYGAIVYSKAPAVIRQLAFVLGEKFRDGLRLYLKEHAYSNAEWGDLVHAFERISGRSLQEWATTWIGRRGMPQVDVDWSCDARQHIDRFTLTQHDVLGEGGVWPIAMQVLLAYPSGPHDAGEIRIRADLNTATAEVSQAVGKPCPEYVFLNDSDQAYGRFLLDMRSRPVVMQQLGNAPDVFQRAMLWGSLWDSVREADLAPLDYLDVWTRYIPSESDESLLQNALGDVTTALHRYVNPEVRAQHVCELEKVASERMRGSENKDLRILWFRALRSITETDFGRTQLKDLLNGKLAVPGVELRPLDRWTLVTELIAHADPEADAYFAAEQKRDPTGDGKKFAYMAEAALPDAATKQRYFHDYLHDPSRPEDWIEQSLRPFNSWNQSELTLPFLRPALDALPQIKRERKIFFVLGWLNAFIGGQQSAVAQSQVREFLASADKSGGQTLDPDLRLKILEVSDELDRTVRIRQRYP